MTDETKERLRAVLARMTRNRVEVETRVPIGPVGMTMEVALASHFAELYDAFSRELGFELTGPHGKAFKSTRAERLRAHLKMADRLGASDDPALERYREELAALDGELAAAEAMTALPTWWKWVDEPLMRRSVVIGPSGRIARVDGSGRRGWDWWFSTPDVECGSGDRAIKTRREAKRACERVYLAVMAALQDGEVTP